MYLSDRDIRQVLAQLDFYTDNDQFPFIPDEQIQPSSIDLRLSNVFWLTARRGTIDLRRARLLELSPRRHWKRVVLLPGESITIKPGNLLLCRTYEKFTIPPECAGKIEGRSSFARMGLAVHCTGEFINPNYRGHMTLQLVNFGPNSIKIFPYLPVCQLLLIKLSSRPTRLYGERELQSKYMDDDGGPSYWWRDKRIKRLHERLGEIDVAIDIQENILNVIGAQEPEVLERFEEYVAKIPVANLDNAEVLLDSFAVSEDRQRNWYRFLKLLLTAIFPGMLGISLPSLLNPPYEMLDFVFLALTILSLPISYYGLNLDIGDFIGKQELWRLRHPRRPVS